jgi:hypothetical protein
MIHWDMLKPMDAPGTAAGAGGGVPGRRALLAAATVDEPFPSAEHIATESVFPKAKGPGCVDTLDLHRRHPAAWFGFT